MAIARRPKTAASRAPAKKVPAAKPRASSSPPPLVQAASEGGDKPRKAKLVRDSFTIPKVEYAVIEQLKKRAAHAGVASKKSELLRAGIMALARMDDTTFSATMHAVPTLRTGRPKKK